MTDFVHRTVSDETVDQGSVKFDLFDRKGRQLGFNWNIRKLTTRIMTEEERKGDLGGYLFDDDNTVRFVGRTHATRAGRCYGASIAAIYGKTLEEVRQGVVRRCAGCEKRYTKQIGKGAV